MVELFYVVKEPFCYDEVGSGGDRMKVFRTGEPLVDRQKAIDYIKTKIDEDEYFEYQLELLEEVEQNIFQSLTLIKTEVGGDDTGPWLEQKVDHLFRERDLFEKRSLITESDIAVFGKYRVLDGIQVLVDDYFVKMNIRQDLFDAVNKHDLKKVKTIIATDGNRNLNQVLLAACEAGDLEITKFCLWKGADINYLDSIPLYHAIYSKNVELVDYLIFKGANWERNKKNILFVAAENNDVEKLNFLIERTDLHENDLIYALCLAAKWGHLQFIETLAEKIADINMFDHEHFYTRESALTIACFFAHENVALFLIRKGAEFLPDVNTVLDFSIRNDLVGVVQKIFDVHKPDPSVLTGKLNYAITLRSIKTISYMLQHGVVINNETGTRILSSFKPDQGGEIEKLIEMVADTFPEYKSELARYFTPKLREKYPEFATGDEFNMF